MAIYDPLRPTGGDSLPVLWKKVLTVLQNRAGALAHNNPTSADPLPETLRKVLRALLRI